MTRFTTTYSLWSLFRNCRKAVQWRYVQELVPIQRDRNLAFGSLIHSCLERWHGTRDLAATLDIIDRACANRAGDEEQRRTWHLATAMMRGYAARYATEDFEVVALEQKFQGEIVNPETGSKSRSFVLAGKVDGIVRRGDGYYLLEHKSAASVDGSYLERLWGDFQIALYTSYVEQALGVPIAGVLYNVLVKARLQQGAGETEAEFEGRRAELLAKVEDGEDLRDPSDAGDRRGVPGAACGQACGAGDVPPRGAHRLAGADPESAGRALGAVAGVPGRPAPGRLVPEHRPLLSVRQAVPVLRPLPLGRGVRTSSRTSTSACRLTRNCATRRPTTRLISEPSHQRKETQCYRPRRPHPERRFPI